MEKLSIKENMEEYHTTDLSLAATLYCMEFKLIRLEPLNLKQRGFVFEDSEELRKAVFDYWNKGLLLEPIKLWNSLKTMKNMLYNEMSQ